MKTTTTPARTQRARCPTPRADVDRDRSVYDRLRLAAAGLRSRERALTVGATGLVHQAVLRAGDETRAAVAAGSPDRVGRVCQEMRREVLDRARSRASRDRLAGGVRAPDAELDHVAADPEGATREALALDVRVALDRLEGVSARYRDALRLRFEVGLTAVEAAAQLGVDERTLRRDVVKARALLACFLGRPAPPG